jgi:NADPH2:quinone reductase
MASVLVDLALQESPALMSTDSAPRPPSRLGVTVVPLSAIGGGPDDLHRLIEAALQQAASGQIRPTIGQTYPLDRAADAHAAIEARATLGKTLLIP